jgi:hypothetical protein
MVERCRVKGTKMDIRFAVFEALDSAIENGYDLVDAKEIAQDLARREAVFENAPVSEIELFVEEWMDRRRELETR